jgi:plasmid replication initiation protein
LAKQRQQAAAYKKATDNLFEKMEGMTLSDETKGTMTRVVSLLI